MISGLDVQAKTSTPEQVVTWGEYKTVLEEGLRSSASFAALPEDEQAAQLEKLGQAIERLINTATQVHSLKEERGKAEARIEDASVIVRTPESWLDIARTILKGEWKERTATVKKAHDDLKVLSARVLQLLRAENAILSGQEMNQARKDLAQIKAYLTFH